MADRQSAPGGRFGESVPPPYVDSLVSLIGDLSENRQREYGLAKSVGVTSCWHSDAEEFQDYFFYTQRFWADP